MQTTNLLHAVKVNLVHYEYNKDRPISENIIQHEQSCVAPGTQVLVSSFQKIHSMFFPVMSTA